MDACSSRGNTRFLYSVLTPELPVSAIGVPLLGLSGSLTLRDCPPSHDDWKTLREALFFRLRRKGLYRLHWLTEWQKRGVPHLHFAAWFLQSVVVININQPALSDSELAQVLSYLISADWLSISSVYRSSGLSQVLSRCLTNLVGFNIRQNMRREVQRITSGHKVLSPVVGKV